MTGFDAKGCIEEQRTEIGKVMSIIEACCLGSDSMLAPLSLAGEEECDTPDFGGALEVAYEHLARISNALEQIARQCGTNEFNPS